MPSNISPKLNLLGQITGIHLLQTLPRQSLYVERQGAKVFNSFSKLAKSVFNNQIIQIWQNHIVPVIANASEGYIQHGYDLIPQWLGRIQRDCAEEFLAFCITGVVRASIRLECL